MLQDNQVVAARLIEHLNQDVSMQVEDLCGRSVPIHSALLDNDPLFDLSSDRAFSELIIACHSRFPGIAFSSEDIRSVEGGFLLSLRGQFKPEQQSERVVSVPCTCRVRLEQTSIRELWFSVDEYSVLKQLGRIASDPGQSAGRSAIVNRRALTSLKEALIASKAVGDGLGEDILVHAYIKVFKDLDKGMDTETFSSAVTMRTLLLSIRERFGEPIDISFDHEISQGHTTTFRGKVRAKRAISTQRYDISCGFRSPGDRVSECWVEIKPPTQIMECLT